MFTVSIPTTIELYRTDRTHFAPINISTRWVFSIQASVDHYCKPQENLEAEEYTHFEVLIIDYNTAFEDFDPVEIFPESFLQYWDGSVFQNVPVKDIQAMIDFVSKK